MSRLVLRISLGMIFVLVASFFIVRWGAQRNAVHHRIHDRMRSHLVRLERARARLERAPADRLDEELKRLQRDLDPDLRLLDPARDRLPEAVRQAWLVREPAVTLKKHRGATIWLPIRNHSRILVVGPGKRIQWVDHPTVVGMVLSLFGVILLTGLVLAWPLVSRLRKLERTAERIGAGQLDARADVGSRDAIGRVAARFNDMADRVQGLLEAQQKLIQAVAHELRTPAARIRFGLEMLGDEDDEEARASRLASIDEDLEELDRLVEELSVYIRVGERALRSSPEPVAVELELSTLLAKLGELRPDMTTALHVDGPEAGTLEADPRTFRRALRNLLDNALRYGRTRVDVRARRDGDRVRLEVCDDGPGIPPEERERVFEPFHRVDASRSRESGGSGLGLAIARRVVEAHGGTISVTDAEGGGACFVTTWPAAGPDTKRYEAVPKGD